MTEPNIYNDKQIKINTQYSNSISATTLSTTTPPNSIFKTNIDGVIQDTKQSEETGDCWLLTTLNAMRDTKWGAKIIKDAIKKDGKGGVIITFKGSKGEQKEFRVTEEEIVIARESGKYSKGDDDVIAFELAMEKYLKLYGTLHGREVNQSAAGGELLDGGRGMGINNFIELLSGKEIDEEHVHYFVRPKTSFYTTDTEFSEFKENMITILDEIEKNPNKYCINFSFNSNCTVSSDPPVALNTDHAYQLKKVVTENGNKYVIFTNPWDSSQEYKLDYNYFICLMRCLTLVENPENEHNKKIESVSEKKINILNTQMEYLEMQNEALKDNNLDKEELRQIVAKTNVDTIELLFNKKSIIQHWIKTFDKAEWGLGHGKAKKALIEPIVNAYCEYALKKGVDQAFVDEVKKACIAELDAIFYTDEKVIIEKLEALYDKINEHAALLDFKEFKIVTETRQEEQ